jgi:hypothetical protein
MSVTPQELDEFHSYVQSRLDQSNPPESLQECLDQWRRERDEEDVLNDIQVATTEIEAGMGLPLDQATHQLREELSWYGRSR